jgi:hypothetical protein
MRSAIQAARTVEPSPSGDVVPFPFGFHCCFVDHCSLAAIQFIFLVVVVVITAAIRSIRIALAISLFPSTLAIATNGIAFAVIDHRRRSIFGPRSRSSEGNRCCFGCLLGQRTAFFLLASVQQPLHHRCAYGGARPALREFR